MLQLTLYDHQDLPVSPHRKLYFGLTDTWIDQTKHSDWTTDTESNVLSPL